MDPVTTETTETTPAVTEKIVEEEAENTPVVASGEEEEQPKESEVVSEAAAKSVDAAESTTETTAAAAAAVATDEPVENGNGDVEPAAEPEVDESLKRKGGSEGDAEETPEVPEKKAKTDDEPAVVEEVGDEAEATA